MKRALQPYCVGGPFGRLLDAESERLGEASVQAFETEGLIGTGAAPAVLAYLFHRIEGRLDGRPTLLIVDEGWLALDDEGFSGQLREWLKTLRKKNASVVFATQSLSDIDGSAIAPAIIESCQTRLFLPNERAIEPQITAIYRRFGLNDRQIEILDSNGRVIARADTGYRELRIAIDYHSDEWHLTREQVSADERRRNALWEAGWIPVVARRDDLATGGREFTGALRGALKLRLLADFPPNLRHQIATIAGS